MAEVFKSFGGKFNRKWGKNRFLCLVRKFNICGCQRASGLSTGGKFTNGYKKELFRIADKRNFDFNLRSGWLDVNLTRTSKGKCSLGVRCAVASPALNTNRWIFHAMEQIVHKEERHRKHICFYFSSLLKLLLLEEEAVISLCSCYCQLLCAFLFYSAPSVISTVVPSLDTLDAFRAFGQLIAS